jgi:hypothetical protein
MPSRRSIVVDWKPIDRYPITGAPTHLFLPVNVWHPSLE